MTNPGHHFVAVIGGAISGSVAAEILADHGIRVAVFEQNTRPYGKIEDGLPRWHVEQRKQEYARIDARMKKQNVYFIPSTKLGRDFSLPQLFEWGFSAVILANGAWRDRELGVPEAEQYVGKGLVYQNPFIYWYNHKNEKDYLGPRYETPDEAVVVGGGLASIDVVKVLQLENYERALKARGIHTSMHELDKGIPEVCKANGIKPEELGVKGCLLIYRRREQDMPLAQPPDNATPDQVAKTEMVRQKMLRLAQNKYLFRVQDRRLTTGIIVENGRLAGLKVVETKIEGRKADPIPGSEHELRAPLVVSSIGSVPEKLFGINMNGEYYTFAGQDMPRYTAMDRVFGVGNVVTGQGNIRVSLVHSQKVTKRVVDCMKGAEGNATAPAGSAAQQVATATDVIGKQIELIPQLSDDQMDEVERQVHALQQKAGFTSDYDSWIAKVTPPDLE
jgi:NADPH-dependent glutamate synthase beta subunit-like oxidoreductase